MTLRIFKYPIRVADRICLDLPYKAQPLRCMMQGDQPQLWCLVDPSCHVVRRNFRVIGTGHPIEDDPTKLVFVDTFIMSGGALVFHLFEVEP